MPRLGGCPNGTYTTKTHHNKSGDDCSELVPDWLNPIPISSMEFAGSLRLWSTEQSNDVHQAAKTQGSSIVRNWTVSELTHVQETADCVI